MIEITNVPISTEQIPYTMNSAVNAQINRIIHVWGIRPLTVIKINR